MLSQERFLATLKQTAREQAGFPRSHNRLTAFFWTHAWGWWLAAALVSAWFFEVGQGRCPGGGG